MKKVYFIAVLMCVAGGCMFLSGCGNKAELNEENSVEQTYSKLEQQILDYEEKYASEEFLLEDYLALADLYHEAFLWKDERILLEQCLRTYEDEAITERLRLLTVNLEEEDTYVAGVIREVFDLIEDGQWDSEVIDVLGDFKRYEQLMPQYAQGCHNYYADNGVDGVLFFGVGYENGVSYTRLAQLDKDGHLYLMTVMSDQLQVFDGTGAWEGENFCCDGAFDLWTINGQDGTLVHENAAMKNNLLDGDYQAQLAVANMDGETQATFGELWNMRDALAYEVYTGSFLAGKSTAEQPDDATYSSWMQSGNYAKVIAYAYNATQEKALWMGIEEDGEMLFGADTLCIQSVPSIIQYAPGKKPVANSVIAREELQIRICDGQVQFYDGKVWVDAGSVSALSMENSAEEFPEDNGGGNRVETDLADNRNIGDIVVASSETEAPATPSAGSSASGAVASPGNSTAASNPAPSQSNSTPTPVTPPAQDNSPSAPVTPPAQDNSPSTPEEPPVQPSDPETPEEPEIEWSDDML